MEREYVQLIGAGSVGRHFLEDHGGMGVHEMARDGIASMGWGICGRQRTRPRQELRDTAMAGPGGERVKRQGCERGCGDIFLANWCN